MLKSGVFSEEENNFVIEHYETMTQKEIGVYLNRKEASIKDRIKKLGLSKVPKKFWTEEELETLRFVWHRENDFMKNFPDRTFQSVAYKAWGLGLKRDGRGGFDVDHDYFKTMDATRAYIIGFIAADGNIYTKRSRLTITQHGNDRYLLEQIKSELKSERPIFERENGIHDIVITSREIVQDLLKIGLTDKKSLTLGRLNIPEEYMSHFVRGYFDGDGCACYFHEKQNMEKPKLSISILGTEVFLKWIREAGNKQAGLPMNSVFKRKGKNIYQLSYNDGTALKFKEWVYKSSQIQLNRKRKKINDYEVDIVALKTKKSLNLCSV